MVAQNLLAFTNRRVRSSQRKLWRSASLQKVNNLMLFWIFRTRKRKQQWREARGGTPIFREQAIKQRVINNSFSWVRVIRWTMATQGARCGANRAKRYRIRPSKMIKQGDHQEQVPWDLGREANSQIQHRSFDRVSGINKYRQKSTRYRERAP